MKRRPTPTNTRLEMVYNDNDFKIQAEALKNRLAKTAKANGVDSSIVHDISKGYIWESTVEHYADSVTGDLYFSCLKKYSLSEKEFVNFFTGDLPVWDTDTYVIPPNYPSNEYKIVVTSNSTEDEVISAFRSIKSLEKELGAKVKRARGPADISLLYAVHKMRSDQRSFPEITHALNSHTLKGYSNDSNQTWSEEDVRKYYHRYKPYIVKRPS